MKRFFLIFITLVLPFISYFLFYLLKSKPKMEAFNKVSFTTKDGITIVGNYYQNKDAKFAGILIHQRPLTKESFDNFAKFLTKEGYSVLAIDLRGHGESVNSVKGKLDYEKFQEEEEKMSINDLTSASLFLEKNGYPKNKQFLVGSSIGANLSFQFLSENQDVKAAVLFSPGLNYRGVILENFKKDFLGDKILTIASKDDPSSYLALTKIKEWYPSSTVFEFQTGGHGIGLLNIYPDLKNQILNWLREKLVI